MVSENYLKQILDKYRENKMAHAYLIETNNQEKCLAELLMIIKQINCMSEFSLNCDKCNICNLIDLNNLPTLKIIEPDGSTIKKSQIQELKESFSSKPIYTKNNIYIIKDAEKLNSSSANTMLKFLEEPDGQVLGFFLTNNKDNIILTIQSRCQIIKANYKEEHQQIIRDISAENKDSVNKILLKYLSGIENNQKSIILENKKEIIPNLLSIVNIESFFKIILDIYKNALYYKREIVSEFIYPDFEFILRNNEEQLLFKINLIVSNINRTSYNVNTELLLDKFVIEMGGTNG